MTDTKKEGLEHSMGLDEVINQLPEGHLARGELAALRSFVSRAGRRGNVNPLYPELDEDYTAGDLGEDSMIVGAVGDMKSVIGGFQADIKQKVRRQELIQMVGHVLPILLETEEDNWPDADDVAEYAVKYAKAALARIDKEVGG